MDFIDTKYISMISHRLGKFKKIKSDLYNFRCPICGDSKKNKNKTRGYLYGIKNNTNYKCHNCGVNISFNNFLKTLDPQTHKQYILEKFKNNNTGKNFTVDEPKLEFKKPVFSRKINLPKATENETSRVYLNSRNLNPDKFYYSDNFKHWVNSIKPTFDNVRYDEPRIVIPLFYNKKLIGVQGRALNKNSIKYITIMFDEDSPKVYGLDEINYNKPIYVVEGPFDSTFIDNSIALCGSDGNLQFLNDAELIFVYDNEPRNAEIVSKLGKVIDSGYKVVIWPNSIDQKDINDMVLSGLDVQSLIESNVHSGLEAKLKFTYWKKI
jgi:hypothetical protein